MATHPLPAFRCKSVAVGVVLIVCLTIPNSVQVASGQSPTPADTPPAEPLIAPAAPTDSRWTIDCVYAGGGSTPGKPVSGAKSSPRLRQESVTKTGDTKCDVSLLDDGSTLEKWTKGSVIASKEPGYAGLSVHVGQPSRPFADFPDFDWISRSRYTGRQKNGTGSYLIFQEEEYTFRFENPTLFRAITSTPDGAPSSDIGSKVPVIAYIDEATRLPVLLKIGRDTRTFHFLSPPSAALTLPPDYATAIGKTLQQLQALTKPLSHP